MKQPGEESELVAEWNGASLIDAIDAETESLRLQHEADAPLVSALNDVIKEADAELRTIQSRRSVAASRLHHFTDELVECASSGDLSLDPQLATGLKITGRLDQAREWMMKLEELNEQLRQPDMPFLFASSSMSMFGYVLGVSKGEPAHIQTDEREIEMLAIPTSRSVRTETKGRKSFFGHRNSTAEDMVVSGRNLLDGSGWSLHFGPEAVRKKFDQAYNTWAINGSDELGKDALFNLWVAAHFTGIADLFPAEVTGQIPLWREELLRLAHAKALALTTEDWDTGYTTELLKSLMAPFDLTSEELAKWQGWIRQKLGERGSVGKQAKKALDIARSYLENDLGLNLPASDI